jgi:hypothetical protein
VEVDSDETDDDDSEDDSSWTKSPNNKRDEADNSACQLSHRINEDKDHCGSISHMCLI